MSEINSNIILYYKFAKVDDPETVREEQLKLCASLGLRGRIIVSEHGINGTLGGEKEALDIYVESMNESDAFNDIEFKWSEGGWDDFPRLSVKYRKELVTLAPDESFDVFDQGTPLRPKEWHEFLAKNPDVTVLDARNNYESDIGVFDVENLVAPDIKTFKEIKPELEKLDKDKPLLTYCTGDIRCEYLSAYMKHRGFKDVYHLDGGIVKYGEEFKDSGFWQGKCFVFDKRMSVAFSDKSDDIGECVHCKAETSRYINCDNKKCNRLMLICENCETETACSLDCAKQAALVAKAAA